MADPQSIKKQETIPNSKNIEEFIQRLYDNNLFQILRKSNGDNEMMVYSCQIVTGEKLVAEIIFNKPTNAVSVRLTGPSAPFVQYFHHALSMIVNL